MRPPERGSRGLVSASRIAVCMPGSQPGQRSRVGNATRKRESRHLGRAESHSWDCREQREGDSTWYLGHFIGCGADSG